MGVKRILIILVFITVIVGFSTYVFIKNEQVTRVTGEPVKGSEFVEEAHAKNNEAYVEELVASFIGIYSDLVNNSSADISFLNDVVIKNSEAENLFENNISTYRAQGKTIHFDNYLITEIKKIDQDIYEVKVNLKQTVVDKNNKKATNEKNVVFFVEFSKDKKGLLRYEES
ncbi:hypothetical protein CPJCM30710_29010 [Clostridium polyendosporum]|uniref:Uncharacterized protein n=1 Tax=Clostridium polyendosporum TaxID=69208 RepID=A0A919S2V2_9CLOT|nr:hypothetical protein [Clostridium polyendosporum]GIM30235.1 hypothetical protein CPJCM30710_29010 [Clostridium polyendosporum]